MIARSFCVFLLAAGQIMPVQFAAAQSTRPLPKQLRSPVTAKKIPPRIAIGKRNFRTRSRPRTSAKICAS